MTASVTHLVVTDNFAGVERYVATVASETVRRGWDVQVIGGRGIEMRRELDAAVRWAPARTLGRAALELGRRRAPDVLHVHMTAAEVIGTLDPRQRHIVSTRHFAATRGSRPWSSSAGRLVARRLAAEVAISDTVRRAATDASPTVVLNGVPTSQVPRAPERVVVVAQRLEAEKQTMDAVRAFVASGLASDGWRLEVYGDGAERNAIHRETERLGASSSISLRGWADDMPAVLARAGIVVATAPQEPYGLVVAEAMAAGAPVVATAAGGHLETVAAVPHARTYAAGDVHGCAQVLRELASATLPSREAYGSDLRAWQRLHLSITTHVDALLEVYATTTGRPTSVA